MRSRWHARAEKAAVDENSSPVDVPLVLAPIHVEDRIAVLPLSDGTFSADAASLAEAAFATREGATHAIHPRLLQLMYTAMRHFKAPYVRIVSGFRDTGTTSRHCQGRAVDMVIPGVNDAKLARFLRTLGFVGVGLYPVSGFVHLDVREQSFFWVDRSGPGRKKRLRRLRLKDAFSADAKARARGETPPVIDSEAVADDAAMQ